MDSDSTALVVRILSRVEQIYLSGEGVDIDFFTVEEQVGIEALINCLSTKEKISSECYRLGSMFLPTYHFDHAVFWDRHCIDKINNTGLISNKCIVDVGSYIGDSLLLFSKWTNKDVHCFEALDKHFKFLCKTIEMNGIKNVITNKMALSDKQGKLCFTDRGQSSRFADLGE